MQFNALLCLFPWLYYYISFNCFKLTTNIPRSWLLWARPWPWLLWPWPGLGLIFVALALYFVALSTSLAALASCESARHR